MKLTSLIFVPDNAEDGTYTVKNPEKEFVPFTLTPATPSSSTVKTKILVKEPTAPGEPKRPLAAFSEVRLNFKGATKVILRLMKDDGTTVATLIVSLVALLFYH